MRDGDVVERARRSPGARPAACYALVDGRSCRRASCRAGVRQLAQQGAAVEFRDDRRRAALAWRAAWSSGVAKVVRPRMRSCSAAGLFAQFARRRRGRPRCHGRDRAARRAEAPRSTSRPRLDRLEASPHRDAQARGLQERAQHFAQEVGRLDHQDMGSARRLRGGSAQPARLAQRQVMREVEDLGGAAADHGRADHALRPAIVAVRPREFSSTMSTIALDRERPCVRSPSEMMTSGCSRSAAGCWRSPTGIDRHRGGRGSSAAGARRLAWNSLRLDLLQPGD